MKVSVIGGAGRMGRWLATHFLNQGHEVTISDINLDEAEAAARVMGVNPAKSNVDAVQGAELIVVSTPIEVTPKVLMEIASHINRSAVIMEISSLKSRVVPVLEKIAQRGVKTVSVHPLFGPGAEGTVNEKVALIPISDPSSELQLAKTFFPGADLIVVEAEEHDKAMALTLSLPHFLNIAFGSVIGEENLETLKKLGGTTFALQLILCEGVMTENPELYASIQMSNEYTTQYLEKFLSRAKTLMQHISKKDAKRFAQMYADTRSSLLKDSAFASAYEKMYRALKALQR